MAVVVKQGPLVVELTGARGVGKSTFAGLLRSELRRRGVEHDQLSPLSRPQRLALEFSNLPIRLRTIKIWKSWQPVSVEKLRIFRRRLRVYQLRTRRFANGSGIYILDEGIVQLMMMLHAGTKQKDARVIFEVTRSLVNFPDVIISVEAPIDAVEARRQTRGNAGDLLKPRLSQRAREAMLSIQSHLRHLATADADVQVIVVDNSSRGALASSAVTVVDQLLKRFDSDAWNAHQPLDSAAPYVRTPSD